MIPSLGFIGWTLVASTVGHAVAASFWDTQTKIDVSIKLGFCGLSACMAIVTAKVGFGL